MAVDLVSGQNGFSMKILMLVIAGYALSRLGQQVFAEAKQYLFAAVAQRAVRGGAMAAFRHLHKLSLQFHLDRQTGGLTRAIDRGAKGIEFLLTIAFFEVLPLFVEVAFVSIILPGLVRLPLCGGNLYYRYGLCVVHGARDGMANPLPA